MRVNLLNDGGYSGLEAVSFPVEVPVQLVDEDYCLVTAVALLDVGAKEGDIRPGERAFPFRLPEFEILPELCSPAVYAYKAVYGGCDD